jgi:hypothetical protein
VGNAKQSKEMSNVPVMRSSAIHVSSGILNDYQNIKKFLQAKNSKESLVMGIRNIQCLVRYGYPK